MQHETYQLIYSLHYYLEDVNTTTGRVLDCVLPHLERLVTKEPLEAHAMAAKMLEAIGEKPLPDLRLRSTFPAYCELLGAPWEDFG